MKYINIKSRTINTIQMRTMHTIYSQLKKKTLNASHLHNGPVHCSISPLAMQMRQFVHCHAKIENNGWMVNVLDVQQSIKTYRNISHTSHFEIERIRD